MAKENGEFVKILKPIFIRITGEDKSEMIETYRPGDIVKIKVLGVGDATAGAQRFINDKKAIWCNEKGDEQKENKYGEDGQIKFIKIAYSYSHAEKGHKITEMERLCFYTVDDFEKIADCRVKGHLNDGVIAYCDEHGKIENASGEIESPKENIKHETKKTWYCGKCGANVPEDLVEEAAGELPNHKAKCPSCNEESGIFDFKPTKENIKKFWEEWADAALPSSMHTITKKDVKEDKSQVDFDGTIKDTDDQQLKTKMEVTKEEASRVGAELRKTRRPIKQKKKTIEKKQKKKTIAEKDKEDVDKIKQKMADPNLLVDTVKETQKQVSNILGSFSKNPKYVKITKMSDFEPKPYNIWSYGKQEPTDTKVFGTLPQGIVEQLLYYYTEPFDVVYDPFGGAGITVDACKKWYRRYYVTDMNPTEIAKTKNIKQWKIQDGIPKELPKPKLVFLDPPYWEQAKGKYSKDPEDLANMSLDDFYSTLNIFFGLLKQKMGEGGHIAVIMGMTQSDGVVNDHAPELYALLKGKKFEFVQRINIPYSTQQVSDATRESALKGKYMIIMYREILIFKKA